MITENINNGGYVYLGAVAKTKEFLKLLKFRLSALVVFSGGFGYMLAQEGSTDWVRFALFCFGSFLITGGANTLNQIIEKETDKLMKRTKDRPLPTGRISVGEAKIFALVLTVVGVCISGIFVNWMTAALSFLSLLLYAFAYTPMKRISPLSVLVGAFPGALPPLIGWVAISGEITMEALIIFGIQFIWQFPHFWAVAWVGHDDYQAAGFRMLPSKGGKDLNTAFQIMMYTLLLIPLGLLPSQFGITGFNSAVVATICGVLFLIQTFYLMKEGTRKAALMMMFGSFLYLPIVQIAFLLDKL